MRLNINKFGIAGGITGVIVYTAEILLYLLLGKESFAGLMDKLCLCMHHSISDIQNVGFGNYLLGTLLSFFIGMSVTIVFALIYNTLQKEK